MKRSIALFVSLAFATLALGQADLPADVRADILQRQILDSARTNDLKKALVQIDEYKSLSVAIPPALILVEAKAAHRTGDALRAFTALKAFLGMAQRGSKGYDEALALYADFERQAAPAIQMAEQSKKKAEREQLEAIAKDTAQKQHAAELRNQERLERNKKQLVDDMSNGVEAIPGGQFQMGSDLSYLGASQPVHNVEIKPFKAARMLVTCGQFRTYIAASGNRSWHDDCSNDYPLISWTDANGFIEWLSNQTGTRYRMLSEAEWEWIARNRKGPSRTSVSYNTELAPRTGLGLEVEFHFQALEQKPDHKASDYQQGEWVADCEHLSYKGAPANGMPWTDASNCDRRVLRGTDFVAQTIHRALIVNNANYWTYDDSAFVAGRNFGAMDQVCGGLWACSFRVATGP